MVNKSFMFSEDSIMTCCKYCWIANVPSISFIFCGCHLLNSKELLPGLFLLQIVELPSSQSAIAMQFFNFFEGFVMQSKRVVPCNPNNKCQRTLKQKSRSTTK